MAIYNSFKTLVWPLNVVKRRVTSAFGLIGGQTSGGPGNEGIDAAVWIQERIDDGTIVTSGAGLADGNKGEITVSGSGATWTVNSNAITTPKITDGAVTNAKAATMAANTVKVRNAATTGVPVDMAVPANTLVGRGSTGDIVPITLGTNLSMAAGVLNATGGATGVTTVTSGGARITYVTLTGTPVVTFSKAGGVGAMNVTGGTIKLIELVDNLQPGDTVSNSIRYDFIGTGTTKLDAYPTNMKYTVNTATPSVLTTGDIGDQQDTDTTPPILFGDFILTGQGTMSARHNNITANIYTKFTWTQK